jgi:phosphocarrier protein
MPKTNRRVAQRRAVTIVNRRGLHARAAAKFVQTVGRHDAVVTVSHDGHKVPGLSIMGLMTLAAAQGTTLTISARGPDAEGVLAALARLVADGFGETD